jgi:membrane-bound metal-dependent hydrolase YbcI (DUF457 family)
MDIATQVLASLALVRAAWPRAPKQLWLVAVAAAIAPEIDQSSAWFGAAAYLRGNRTYSHSLLSVFVLALLFAFAYRQFAPAALRSRFAAPSVFTMVLAILALHLVLDVCGWRGTSVLCPFTSHRFSLDWLADTDPWFISILCIALLLPEIRHLVTSEIGARDARPRGQLGAILGFAILLAYLAIRANFHASAVAQLDAHTYRGEVPHRVAAFPRSLSPFTWGGAVDTASALHLLPVTEGPAPSFDPERADTQYKPEPSPALAAAQDAPAARQFLKFARFPQASVETTPTSVSVTIRDLTWQATKANHELAAFIRIDANGHVTSQKIVWASALSEQ